jgi:hypothetical protein
MSKALGLECAPAAVDVHAAKAAPEGRLCQTAGWRADGDESDGTDRRSTPTASGRSKTVVRGNQPVRPGRHGAQLKLLESFSLARSLIYGLGRPRQTTLWWPSQSGSTVTHGCYVRQTKLLFRGFAYEKRARTVSIPRRGRADRKAVQGSE